jgi:hypothetical protein
MSKVFYNGSIANFRGRIGNLIFRQLPDGTTVVSTAPSKETGRRKKRAKERRSQRQKDHNERFRKTAIRAKQAAKTHPIYAELAAATLMRTAYSFALSDGMKPPIIHRIERRKGQIRVEATDNIGVVRVRVTVRDEQGQIMEQGEATRGRGNWWKFTPQTAGGSILAEAWDLPKNKATLVLE